MKIDNIDFYCATNCWFELFGEYQPKMLVKMKLKLKANPRADSIN